MSFKADQLFKHGISKATSSPNFTYTPQSFERSFPGSLNSKLKDHSEDPASVLIDAKQCDTVSAGNRKSYWQRQDVAG